MSVTDMGNLGLEEDPGSAGNMSYLRCLLEIKDSCKKLSNFKIMSKYFQQSDLYLF